MTQIEKQRSFSQLKEFTDKNDLQDDMSNIQFPAKIFIKTSSNEKVFYSTVRVQYQGYNGYGVLSIIDNDNVIDSNQYPTEFSAEWQEYSITDTGNLCIKGNHTKNKQIGEYEVIIQIDK
jgi:hypothetical protein